MRQRKAPDQTPLQTNIKEFFDKYDSVSLAAALRTFEATPGWELFKSFLYYQAAVHGTMSNVLIQQTGRQFEACSSGAKAEVLREVVDVFMDNLYEKIKGNEGVVEGVVPQEM
jgi:hypothetical protein